MALFNIIPRFALNIVGHLRLTGRLPWEKTRTGLSIFWPDDGLDEGPIMLQKTCEIGPDETLGDVYFNKLFPMGVDAMLEGLDLIKSGVQIKHDQRLEDGTYEGWFRKDDAKLDWSKPIAEVYNIIRAANPAPGAWTTQNGSEVKIYDAAKWMAKVHLVKLLIFLKKALWFREMVVVS